MKAVSPTGTCVACGLHEGALTPCLGGNGKDVGPLLAIVAEQPSHEDDIGELAFSSWEGRYISDLLREMGVVARRDCWVTYAVRCRQRVGKLSPKSVKACREHLHAELLRVRPKVVVTLGAAAHQAMAGTSRGGLTGERGSIVGVEVTGPELVPDGTTRLTKVTFPHLPAWSVGYVQRNPAAAGELAADLQRAVAVARDGGRVPELPVTRYRAVLTEADCAEALAEVRRAKRIAWDTETAGTDPLNPFLDGGRIVCVTFSTEPGTGWLIPFDHTDRESEASCRIEVSEESCERLVRRILQKGSAPLVGQNLKFDMLWVERRFGFRPRLPAFDCAVAHHLLFEEGGSAGGHGLKRLAWAHTEAMGGYELPLERAFPDLYQRMDTLPIINEADPRASLLWYACGDVDVALQVQDSLAPLLIEEGLVDVLDLEMDKLGLLVSMESEGMPVDWGLCAALEEKFTTATATMLAALRDLPAVARVEAAQGAPFNPASPVQMRKLLVDELGLEPSSYTATGAVSTAADALDAWAEDFPPGSGEAGEVLALLSAYRATTKLLSAYITALPTHRCSDGRVHPRFKQFTVKTHRLSAEAPNVMQLPRSAGVVEVWPGAGVSKGDVKALYAVPEDEYLAEVDYSQIELRVAALMSQDPLMCDVYLQGRDLHTETAARIYGKPAEAVTPEERTAAKSVNFGIIYGMSAPALARNIGVSISEAEDMLGAFWSAYAGLRAWSERMRGMASREGFVSSLFGHRRHLPAAMSRDFQLKESALRQAGNAPIQTTASNLCIYSAAYLDRILREDGWRSRVVSQVHDSIIVRGPEFEQPGAVALAVDVLENPPFDWALGEDPALPLHVPLVADAKVGKNLRDMGKWTRESASIG